MPDASHAGDAYLSTTPSREGQPREGHGPGGTPAKAADAAGPGGGGLGTPTGKPSAAGSHRVRVRYCECDPMGVAHHAAYIPWLEEGRTELLRGSGISYADMERAGVFLVITRLEMKYRRPVLYDDVVEIRTKWVGGSRVKIEHEYEVVVAERGVVLGIGKKVEGLDGVPVAVGTTTLACVGRDGRPMMLPEWLMPEGVQKRRG